MIEMISSAQNSHVKKLKQVLGSARKRKNLEVFAVEGEKMVSEAPPELIEEIYVSQTFLETHEHEWLQLLAEQCFIAKLNNNLFNSVADTVTPQGIIAVLKQPVYEFRELFEEPAPLIIMLERLQDPGNIGTIIRTAVCAGAAGVILSPGCVDVFSPKAVRATMGGIFELPFIESKDFEADMEKVRAHDIPVYAADASEGGRCCYDVDFTGGAAIVIGNEGHGVSEDIGRACDGSVYIPMARGFESLNAAMSAGIIMYEAARQKYESNRR